MPPETTAGNSVYVRGLPCELAVIDAFDEARATVLHRQDVRDYLARHGQMKSTIARTVPRMVKSGNLATRPHNFLELTCRDLPRTRRVRDPRTVTPNRFGETDLVANADYVRQHYADRLDELWECPNSYLARVLRAVELAGRIAEAACLDRPHALAEAVAEYRREWLSKESNMWRRPLDAVRVFEALQVGLFPETFLEDEEVQRELTEHYEKLKRERAELIARTNAENAERIADGEKAIPLPTGRFETPRDALKGLVIKSGGQRVGLVRLAAYVAAIGAKGGAAEVDGARSGAA